MDRECAAVGQFQCDRQLLCFFKVYTVGIDQICDGVFLALEQHERNDARRRHIKVVHEMHVSQAFKYLMELEIARGVHWKKDQR